MKYLLPTVLLLSSFCIANQAEAQLPPGWVSDGDGVHVNADLTKEEWEDILEVMGDDFAGGFFNNKELCEAAISSQVSGLGEVAIDVLDVLGSLVGVCPSQATFDQIIRDTLWDLEDACDEQEGISLVMLDRAGCAIPALRVIDCDFVPPTIAPSCDGLRELCEDTKAFGEVTPPDGDTPGHLTGYYEVPGCTCTLSYVIGEPVCEEPLGPRMSLPGEP